MADSPQSQLDLSSRYRDPRPGLEDSDQDSDSDSFASVPDNVSDDDVLIPSTPEQSPGRSSQSSQKTSSKDSSFSDRVDKSVSIVVASPSPEPIADENDDQDEEEDQDKTAPLEFIGAVGGIDLVAQPERPSSVVEILDSESEDEDEFKYQHQRNESVLEVVYDNHKQKAAAVVEDKDITEITARLKKQVLEAKKPLVKYLDEPPYPGSVGPLKETWKNDTDQSCSSPQRKKTLKNVVAANYGDYQADVTKCAKLLAAIIEEMPVGSDDHTDFEVPKKLNVTLYPHQVYGAKWLCWREQQYPGGGILADEMGLGKTVMAIALILKGKERVKETKENWCKPEARHHVPTKATLVVCPVGCITQWESEVKKKASGLKVYMHHGPTRSHSAALIAQNDVVLTTYATITSEIPRPDEDQADKCKSPLYRLHWERIVLDEGHVIRNPSTHISQSVGRLQANHRWVVSGTPVHNRPGDFFSLVRFLRLEPFDDKKVWDFWIGLKTIKPGCSKRFETIGKALLLRRTKAEVASLSDIEPLPTKHIEDVRVQLSEAEEPVYKCLFDYAKNTMTKFLAAREERMAAQQGAAYSYVSNAMKGRSRKQKNDEGDDEKFSSILVLITRLRQLPVLPFLIKTMLEDENADDEEESYDVLNDPVNALNPVFDPGFRSSKMKAVMRELKKLKEEAEVEERPMDKVIIVSQWTTFLDIFYQHLVKRGYHCVSLDGRMNIVERADTMRSFNENPRKPNIMLLSITAGGVGLNLVGANHVFFMEPNWNPQIELQAMDRVHRYGQKKPVFIKRFIVEREEDSFENHILKIQSSKLELADQLLNNTKKKRGAGLSITDIKALFGL